MSPQFSLRTVLWIMLAVALLTGWWTDRWQLKRSVAEQTERLAVAGAQSVYWQKQHALISNLYGKLRQQVEREDHTSRELSAQQTLMSQQALSEARA